MHSKKSVFRETPKNVTNILGNNKVTKSRSKRGAIPKEIKSSAVLPPIKNINIPSQQRTSEVVNLPPLSAILKFITEKDRIPGEAPDTCMEITVDNVLERYDFGRTWGMTFFDDLLEYESQNGLARDLNKIRLE